MTKIYFASPLFSEMELAFNKVLVERFVISSQGQRYTYRKNK